MGIKKRNKRVGLIAFKDLTEKQKDNILDHLRITGEAIAKAQFRFDVTAITINKIFEERFNNKEKNINNLVKDCKKIVDDLRNN
jgi:hypothetical protein